MADTITLPNPIFYETLAEAARCTPADAYEHFHTIRPKAQQHHVEAFLEDYAVSAE